MKFRMSTVLIMASMGLLCKQSDDIKVWLKKNKKKLEIKLIINTVMFLAKHTQTHTHINRPTGGQIYY